MVRSCQGSITVFLTLVFLLIIAMVGTTIEVSRYEVCKNHTWRTLESGTASLFSEYNRPLYDAYRLFLIEDTGEPFEQTIADYMNDSLNPGNRKRVDLIEGTPVSVEVEKKKYVGEEKGQAMAEQINRFMKSKLAADAFAKFLPEKDEFAECETKAEELKEQIESEKEEAKENISTLKLMEVVDGVKVFDGAISGSTDFLKMMVPEETTAADVSIHNSKVWKVVSPKMVTLKEGLSNPKSCLRKMKKILKKTEQAMELVKEAGKEELEFVLRGNKRILEKSITLLESGTGKDVKEKVELLWKDYRIKELSFDYSGISEKGGDKNPKDVMASLFGNGILDLVMKDVKEISESSVDTADCFAGLYQEEAKDGINFQKRIMDFLKEDTADFVGVLGDISSYAESTFYFDRYLHSFFGHYNQSAGQLESALEYEMEYIISGKTSDKENLKRVAERLLLLRSMKIFPVLCTDRVKTSEAHAMAVGIVGFTGMEPLIRLTQTLILVTWSIAEGMVDVAALLQGEKVPVLKSSKEMKVGLSELLTINQAMIQKKAKEISVSKGFDYGDYLSMFLATMNSSVKRYRMMDLIQWNMEKNHSKEFRLDTCVYAVDVAGTVSYPTKFLQMPVLVDMLRRDLKGFYHKARVHYEY